MTDVRVGHRCYPLGRRGSCWFNAWRALLAGGPGHRYVAGWLWLPLPDGCWATGAGPHAWVLNPEGQVVETTPLPVTQWRYQAVSVSDEPPSIIAGQVQLPAWAERFYDGSPVAFPPRRAEPDPSWLTAGPNYPQLVQLP